MKKIKRKLKWENLIMLILLFIFSAFFIYSTINIIKWAIDNKKTNEQISQIDEQVTIKEIDDNINTKIIEQDNIDKSNPYWDYIKMKLIDVDFNELTKTNKDIVGWLQVNGTNINYPFVQTNNNTYYLTHSFDKKYNSAGWVFLDYRNNINSLDFNTLIYAHGRIDTTMFGSLKNILKSNWLNNINNYVIKMSTKTENTLWQVFSIYHIPTTSDYLYTNFNQETDYLNFINTIKTRSFHDFKTEVNEKDKILTLSTCYNNDEKMVMHAKLIKKEIKDATSQD